MANRASDAMIKNTDVNIHTFANAEDVGSSRTFQTRRRIYELELFFLFSSTYFKQSFLSLKLDQNIEHCDLRFHLNITYSKSEVAFKL